VPGEVLGDGLGTGMQGDYPLEVFGAVFPVGNVALELVLLPPVGSPPGGVEGSEDAVDAVGGQEAVFDALLQRVGVKRFAEVGVGVPVVLSKRRCGHAQLEGGFEVFEDVPPVRFVTRAPPVALVDDDEIKEVRGVFLVEAGTFLVGGD